MRKGQRPSRHIRRVRTKKGRKPVLVNKDIRKKKPRMIARRRGSNKRGRDVLKDIYEGTYVHSMYRDEPRKEKRDKELVSDKEYETSGSYEPRFARDEARFINERLKGLSQEDIDNMDMDDLQELLGTYLAVKLKDQMRINAAIRAEEGKDIAKKKTQIYKDKRKIRDISGRLTEEQKREAARKKTDPSYILEKKKFPELQNLLTEVADAKSGTAKAELLNREFVNPNTGKVSTVFTKLEDMKKMVEDDKEGKIPEYTKEHVKALETYLKGTLDELKSNKRAASVLGLEYEKPGEKKKIKEPLSLIDQAGEIALSMPEVTGPPVDLTGPKAKPFVLDPVIVPTPEEKEAEKEAKIDISNFKKLIELEKDLGLKTPEVEAMKKLREPIDTFEEEFKRKDEEEKKLRKKLKELEETKFTKDSKKQDLILSRYDKTASKIDDVDAEKERIRQELASAKQGFDEYYRQKLPEIQKNLEEARVDELKRISKGPSVLVPKTTAKKAVDRYFSSLMSEDYGVKPGTFVDPEEAKKIRNIQEQTRKKLSKLRKVAKERGISTRGNKK